MDRRLCVSLVAAASVALSARPSAADVRHPFPYPTLAWAALQLVPSPGLVVEQGRSAFAAQWSVTPILYSFGMYRSLSPWRAGVVEPVARHSGSLELRGGVDYFALTQQFADRFGARVGLRTTWPILERGESLSWCMGTSLGWFGSKTVAGYEAGIHTLLGTVGAVIGLAPTPEGPRWLVIAEVKVL